MELFDLTGKVAVITGSSRGIGKAIAERLAEHGARVVISSRKAGPCDEVASAINARHGEGRAIAVPANIASKEDLQRLVDETNAAFGQIDILVCNAATNPYAGPMAGINDEQFGKILQNNVVSNHWLIQMVAPQMLERKDGSVIIVSSIGGLRGNALIGAYNISKAADMQLARNLAVEWGPHGVRVNAISPGFIATELSGPLLADEAFMERRMAMTPLRRPGTPQEVAGAAVFLASDAGAFVTGHNLVVDGGTLITDGS
jgi:NAD(P)-dependent dehydrogenase (short-subunit alcohol dehydrogenase family)